MAINFNLKSTYGCSTQSSCLDKFGCPANRCPDFIIRRRDTRPAFKVTIEDCNGALSIQGMVAEANMWALAALKASITEDDTYFQLADHIGFEQVMVGDIIVMDRIRNPEQMLVTAIDEDAKAIQVQRSYRGTTASAWAKGKKMRIFRFMNSPVIIESTFDDIQEVDGTITSDVLMESALIYEWDANDTCLPGCYWMEFTVYKMIEKVYYLPGGDWVGEIHTHSDDRYYTGSSHTDSSVILSYDQIQEKYFLPHINWSGEFHTHTDDFVYTGSSHDDGSVILDTTGIPSESSYNEDGIVALASITPSFIESLTSEDYGCALPEGVETVRKFPLTGEGFLIKIENTFTSG